MFKFLFAKKEQHSAITEAELNKVYSELKKAYPADNIPEIRKKYLSMHIQKYGYLTYSFQKAREVLKNITTPPCVSKKRT